ncbi:MAG TPA: hypothetical protein VEQ58_04615 [Polyangiaceae bacterium]|nr:hypothetical protein [Polyangiaceae bacterium]
MNDTAAKMRGAVKLGGWLSVLAAALLSLGCAGGVRGATHVAIAFKTCPEVTNFVGNAAADWSSTLGIEPGDADTLKGALKASGDIEKQVAGLDGKLGAACSGLIEQLAAPVADEATPASASASETSEQVCGRATRRLAEAKAQLGAAAKVTTSKAQGGVAVEVSNVSDEEAAFRYQQATQTFLTALVVLNDGQTNVRALIADARAAIELGVVAGQAISAGDAASAAASAVCILPPLIEAKKRIAILRRDLKLMNELAKLAGLSLPRPPSFDEPVAAHTSVGRGAPPTVPAPFEGRVLELFAFPDGGMAAQTPQGVVSFPDGQLLLRTRPERGATIEISIGGGGGGDVYCAVGAGHRVACIRPNAIFAQNGQHIGTDLLVFDSAGGVQVAARASARGQVMPDGITFDASGQLIYAYTLQDVYGDRSFQVSRVVRGGMQLQLPFTPEHGALEDIGSGGRIRPPITFADFRGRQQMLYRDGRTLLLSPLDQPRARVELAKISAYDVRAVTGGDGVFYVFYYESKSRTARVAVSMDGVSFRDQVLDGRESGWQLDAVPTDDGALAVYYYFRNTYNKGLRLASLRGGKLARSPQAIMREDRFNAGWHPHLVSDGNRGAWLTYLSNVEAEQRAWTQLSSAKELLDYAMVDTGVDSEDDYKDWFLQAGVGGWYTWWGLAGAAPKSEEVDGATLHEARYHVKPSLLLSANLEGRYGPINIGLSYAQNYLDDASKKLGEANRLLSGSIKIEDLLPGHDVKVEGVWGRYHGRVTQAVEGEADAEMPLDTSYLDVHLFALNQWRVKYGLQFQRFQAPTPVLAFYAPKDQVHYLFATSELRDVTYNNVDLAIGYSKLDYLAKYENDYFGPILDGGLAGGLSFTSFDKIATPGGDLKSGLAIHARVNLQAGWLWMSRVRSLAGLGFYLRPSYLAEGALITASLSRPKDREQKDAGEAATDAGFLLYSLRHGPWLDAGIVW